MAIRETGALCDEGEDIIMEFNHGVLFSDTYQKKLKSQFCYADKDPQYGARLFFENSGGSLRLKKAVEAKAAIEEFPDCPERARGRGFDLADYVKDGTQQILEVIFGAKSGALITELTASQTMFHAVGTIMEGVDWGKNAVTSALEHPSAHDAVEYYCKKTGREFREVPANKVTGGLDPDEIMKYVDKDTVLLSIMAASNISGNIMDIKEIARRAKEINPDIYIVAVEPASSPVLAGGEAASHRIQGIGANFIPKLYDASVVDEVIGVPDDEAIRAGRELAATEGLLAGISSGAAVYAARQLSQRPEFKNKKIVALLPDTGERYLSTELFAFDAYPLD